MRRQPRTGRGRAGRRRARCRGTGCRSAPAATASPSSTTPTTPTRIRCGPGCRRWPGWPGQGGGAEKRRSWAVLGEMAELGDDAISEHDRIGRLAVRLDVSRLVVVGTGRSMSAMHHGAVMEGSWGSRGHHGRRRRRRAGAAAGRTAARGRGAGQGLQRGRARARWPTRCADGRGRPADEADPHRRRHRADGVDPADPGADPAVHPAGLRPRDPRGRPAEPPHQARHAVDGRRRDPGRHLGGLPGHAPGRAGARRRRARPRRACWCWAWPPRSAPSDSSTT